MIESFSIENFGPIKDKVTLSFEAGTSTKLEEDYIIRPKENVRLLKLGMIYGANASGKTSVLRALNFLRELVVFPIDRKTDPLAYNPFMFCEGWESTSTAFNLIYYLDGIKYDYFLRINRKAILKESLHFHEPNRALLFERSTDVATKTSSIKFGGKVESITQAQKTVLEGNTLWNDTVFGGYLKTNIKSPLLEHALSWFMGVLKPMIEPHTELKSFNLEQLEEGNISKEQIIEVLSKADLNIDDFEVHELKAAFPPEYLGSMPDQWKNKMTERLHSLTKKEIVFTHSINSNNYFLPYALESSGTQRYFQLSGTLALLLFYTSVIPIDEIESSLHPELLEHFLILFLKNSETSQLICTSHFREFLMNRNLYRDDAIWFTEKNDKGATELFSLADFPSDVIRDTSSVFNAYKIGKLGAVPHLSDTYLVENGEE